MRSIINPSVAAGVVAGLAAGMLLSAAWLAIEAATGEPTELVQLGRRALAKSGHRARPDSELPDADEQVWSHGGHLALSAAAGAAYGWLLPASGHPLVAGAGFGAVFYALAYGLLAPLLRLRPAMWNDERAYVAQRGLFHLLFGVVTARLTPAVARTLRRSR